MDTQETRSLDALLSRWAGTPAYDDVAHLVARVRKLESSPTAPPEAFTAAHSLDPEMPGLPIEPVVRRRELLVQPAALGAEDTAALDELRAHLGQPVLTPAPARAASPGLPSETLDYLQTRLEAMVEAERILVELRDLLPGDMQGDWRNCLEGAILIHNSLENAIARHVPTWSPMDSPTEVVGHLAGKLEELEAVVAAAWVEVRKVAPVDKLGVALADVVTALVSDAQRLYNIRRRVGERGRMEQVAWAAAYSPEAESLESKVPRIVNAIIAEVMGDAPGSDAA